jgi:2,3-bisphosphoglycerate-dependent phosphoglycerate mutase
MYKTFLILLIFLSSCTTTYYIVRHGEKEAATSMSSDVKLSAAGEERAEALKQVLKNKHIQYVYSTNTARTKGTVRPLAETLGVDLETYDPRDSTFIDRVKKRGKGNAIIVGHSNTVDDIVNGFFGKHLLSDLPDNAYGDLFIIKRKGKHYTFSKSHFGR